MSHQQPSFYDLTFSVEAPFWDGGDASSRSVYLMPSPHNPAEFLAFGVVGSPDNVRFVARGPLATRLGAFIDRMLQDEARVELHARAPVPGRIIHQYTGGGPWEGQVPEEPPPPPSEGRIAVSTASDMEAPGAEVSSPTVPLWPRDNANPRSVYVLRAPGSDRFVAFGVLENAHPEHIPLPFRVPFVARGSASTDLPGFLARMEREKARVKQCTRAELPLESLRAYAATYVSEFP